MAHKLINLGGQPLEIRLVKRTNAAVGLRNGILPDGAVNNTTEFSFKLGSNASYEHIVLAHSDTPNLINPSEYITNGDLFTLTNGTSDDVRIVGANVRLTEADPNYATKKVGVFYKVRASDAIYVLGDKPNSPAPVAYQVIKGGQTTTLSITDIMATKGSYFADDHYYVPLFLGTLKELQSTWLAGPGDVISFSPHWTQGANKVQHAVAIVKIIPVTGLSINNTQTDVNQNTDVNIDLAITPIDAGVASKTFTSSNTDVANFVDAAIGKMRVNGVGSFDVTAKVVDELGNQIQASKVFFGLPDIAPFVVESTTTATTRKVGLLMAGMSNATIVVDWGDGTREVVSNASTAPLNHTYTSDATFQIKLYTKALVPFIQYLNANGGDKDLTLRKVVSWGELNTLRYQFSDCGELTTAPIVAPPYADDYTSMFNGCTKFNSDLSGWNTSRVTLMGAMFSNAPLFNSNLAGWNVSNVTSMSSMFANATSFNGTVAGWDVTSLEDANYMFDGAVNFNQPLTDWDTVSLLEMNGMFRGAVKFNQNLSHLKTGKVTSLDSVFSGATAFNGTVIAWDVSSVTSMYQTFYNATAFNQSVATWNTSKVTTFNATFSGASSFEGLVMNWDVSRATTMLRLFENAANFKGAIGGWNVSAVTDMTSMFKGASRFNSDISEWNVGNVDQMGQMFQDATVFNQRLKWWCVSKIASAPSSFALRSSLAAENMPMWGLCPIRDTVATIVGLPTYLIVGDSRTLSVTLNPNQPIQSVVWSADNSAVVAIDASTGEYVFLSEGVATISVVVNGLYNASVVATVSGSLQPFTFTTTTDSTVVVLNPTAEEIVIDWGDGTRVTTSSFDNAHTYSDGVPHNVKVSAPSTELPPLEVSGGIEEVTSWYGGYQPSIKFGGGTMPVSLTKIPAQPPQGWNDASGMFQNCTVFNQDISGWDVSHITSMAGMFRNAEAFNQDISGWDVSNVTDMTGMFEGARSFNQDLVLWCVSGVTEAPTNFNTGATAFKPEFIPVWGTCPNRDVVVTLAVAKTTIGLGLKERVTYTIDPAITVEEESWTIDDPDIFSVTTRGLVTAKTLGSTYVNVLINKTYRARLRLTATEASFDAEVMVFEINRTSGTVRANFTDSVGLPATIDWGDGTLEEITTAAQVVHTYAADAFTDKAYIQVLPSNRAKLNISGDFSRVLQWSSLGYESLTLGNSGSGSPYLIDVPQVAPPLLTRYTDLFLNCTSFDDDLSGWNVSQVTDISGTFQGCTNFNGDVTTWDVSNVVGAYGTFQGCTKFNQDISGWNTAKMVSMTYMFSGASLFNADISGWDVSSATDMAAMFYDSPSFNRDLSWWCVANIPSLPASFNESSPLLTEDKLPVWGTCPNRSYGLIVDNPGDVKVTKTAQLTYNLNPPSTIVTEVWESSNDTIATVTDSGVVTGVSEGSVTMTVTLNKVYTSSVTFDVVPNIELLPPTNLNLVNVVAPTDLTGQVNESN